MKKLIIISVLFFLSNSYGFEKSFSVDASSTNITNAFTQTAESLVMSGLFNRIGWTICNETAVRLAVNDQTYSAGVTPSSVNYRIPAGGCFSPPERIKHASRIFIKSDVGTIAAGTVHGNAD